jgi:ABC-type dipeptide/oligopeptide/nickel transport system permease subunit
MPDLTAIELEARDLSPTLPTRLIDHVLAFFSRALFTVALVAAGATLVTIALTVGVVGSPVIFVALVALALRRRRLESAGADAVLPAAG